MPIQNAVKKVSRQIAHSAEDLRRQGDSGVLLIVNNGYSNLNADNFEHLVVQHCRNDSAHINYAFCVTVDYLQRDFDAYIFLTARCHTIHDEGPWRIEQMCTNTSDRRFG